MFTYHKADLVISWGGSYEPSGPVNHYINSMCKKYLHYSLW